MPYNVVSPEVIYTQATLNELSKLYVYIYAYVTVIITEKEAISLRESGKKMERAGGGTWQGLKRRKKTGNLCGYISL